MSIEIATGWLLHAFSKGSYSLGTFTWHSRINYLDFLVSFLCPRTDNWPMVEQYNIPTDQWLRFEQFIYSEICHQPFHIGCIVVLVLKVCYLKSFDKRFLASSLMKRLVGVALVTVDVVRRGFHYFAILILWPPTWCIIRDTVAKSTIPSICKCSWNILETFL